MDKVVEDVGDDDDFKSAAWVIATNYVNRIGGTVTGCLGDEKDTAFWFLRFGSCVLSLAFCLLRFDSCILVLRFGLAFCLVEDFYCVLLRRDFAQLKTSLCFVSKVGCVSLRDKLRFASRQVTFCFKTSAFCFKIRCVLLQDTQMHNNIMAAGSRDRPPMLATGRYPQWRSRFLRYVDTRPNGDALRKCIKKRSLQTYNCLSSSTQEMWEAIKRLQQGESLNIQDVKTNLFWEFGKFTSHDGETMESYYTRFYKMMNEMICNNLIVARMQVNVQFLQQLQPERSRFVTIVKQQHKVDEVSYHKLFDNLKQYQKEVNELRAERLARNANPLALVATSSKPLIPTRTHMTTRYKGKEIVKPITPPSETASEEDSDPKQAQRDKDMQKNLALITKYFKKIYKPNNNNLRTSLNSRNKNMDTNPWNAKSQKGIKTPRITRKKMLLHKQAEQGVPLQAEQYDWLADMDEEIDEQELEAHYSYMAKIQEVPTADSCTDSEPLEQVQSDAGYNVFANDLQHSEQSESISNTCLVETNDSNVIP
nr:hypothetical protein [Tanacetum cinerariifolium]